MNSLLLEVNAATTSGGHQLNCSLFLKRSATANHSFFSFLSGDFTPTPSPSHLVAVIAARKPGVAMPWPSRPG